MKKGKDLSFYQKLENLLFAFRDLCLCTTQKQFKQNILYLFLVIVILCIALTIVIYLRP